MLITRYDFVLCYLIICVLVSIINPNHPKGHTYLSIGSVGASFAVSFGTNNKYHYLTYANREVYESMDHKTLKKHCIDCFTVIHADSQTKVTDEFLFVGNSGINTYKAFLYIDIDELPVDTTTLQSARLRIYVQLAETEKQRYTLYLQTLTSDPSAFGIVRASKQEQVSVSADKDHCGWLDFDISDIVKKWCSPTSKNYGLIINTDESSSSMITFSSSVSRPEMILEISQDDPLTDDTMRIIQRFWKFQFNKMDASPPINVSFINQATFFVTNKGQRSIVAIVETSSDLFHWIQDARRAVDVNKTIPLVGKYYGKYYRLRFTAVGSGKAEVSFIGQFYASPKTSVSEQQTSIQ